MLLLLDNYDSFTYNLKDYFEQLGEEVVVIKNDEMSIEDMRSLPFNKLVLSPGPKTPSVAGNMMEVIETFHKQLPILGICLGHQAIGEFFGADLVKAIRPMHGKTSLVIHDEKGVYRNIPNPLTVCRYHSLILKNMEATPLKVTAETEEKECMGFSHVSLPLTGMQFHPEAILTDCGLQLLQNWLLTITQR